MLANRPSFPPFQGSQGEKYYVLVLSQVKNQACRVAEAKVKVQLLTGISGDPVHDGQ